MAPTIQQYQPVSYGVFGQRPLVDPQAFNGLNTLISPQHPGAASYLGLPLAALGPQVDPYPHVRAAAIEQILEKIRANPHLTSLQKDTAGDYLVNRTDGPQLHSEAMALIEQALISPDAQTIENPKALFDKLLMAGSVKPPAVDLGKLSRPEDGAELMRACEFVFRYSGLPKLSQALGLRDVIGNEAGSRGHYAPVDEKFFDPTADYSHRVHVGVSSRLAWNRWTHEALMVRNPLIPANMRCVTDLGSAQVAIKNGLCPVISMDYSDSNRRQRLEAAEKFGAAAFITVRTNESEQKLAGELLRQGAAICIEMANANMPRLVKMVRELKQQYPQSFIMVGNVGSVEGYMLAVEAGADVVKLGRGPGAGCTTPEETGLSPGQITLAYECALAQLYLLTYRGLDVPFILDGGISKSGHVLLGAMLGAETFMMGSFFATLDESPAPRVQNANGTMVVYFGEASTFAQIISARNAEELEDALRKKGQGIVGLLPPTGRYEEAVPKFLQGIQGGVADLNFAHLAQVMATEFPLVIRKLGPGAAQETSTRLGPRDFGQIVELGRFDKGYGGEEAVRAALGI